MINILIVDDSETEAHLLKTFFEAEVDMRVIGHAKNGQEAIDLTKKLKPDIITMDILMPIKNGFEATRVIMAKTPTPIVVISSTASDVALNTTFLALEAGALSVLEKPVNFNSTEFNEMRKRIVDTVRSMSQIKVITHRFHSHKRKGPVAIETGPIHQPYEVIGIGVSVGGPQALKSIFSRLPTDFPVPIVVVQHMTPGFIQGFVHWLDKHCALTVKLAEPNEELLTGTIYFAPDNRHLRIIRRNEKLFTSLITSAPVSGFCPSATVLLQSLAQVSGQHAMGVLLTGMGNDGAQGLLELKNAKGHTIIQDKESAVVFGMAGVALMLNATDKIIALDKMADYLIDMTK
ncbi:MAG: chemotaxis-specific protein-glutamate methyltransferase CheB [Gammaproteobacteria bacterium]|nr:chemotaxis-specific protein-glutamate methyltransferase CheB [Gammaproteobacteria bacterium]